MYVVHSRPDGIKITAVETLGKHVTVLYGEWMDVKALKGKPFDLNPNFFWQEDAELIHDIYWSAYTMLPVQLIYKTRKEAEKVKKEMERNDRTK